MGLAERLHSTRPCRQVFESCGVFGAKARMSRELALSGQLRPVKGVLAIALEAKRRHRQTRIVPAEAAVVEGVEVVRGRFAFQGR